MCWRWEGAKFYQLECFNISTLKEEIQLEYRKQKGLSTDQWFSWKCRFIFRESPSYGNEEISIWARHVWNLKTDIFKICGENRGLEENSQDFINYTTNEVIFIQKQEAVVDVFFFYCCRVSILVPVGYCPHKEWERRCGPFFGLVQRYNRHESEDYSRR